MTRLYRLLLLVVTTLAITSCHKETCQTGDEFTYYEVGFDYNTPDWRDTAFVVRTTNPQLILQCDAELAKPVAERKIVFGNLLEGSGGYNKNGSHEFLWRFGDNNWSLVDVTVEIYDGKPHADIDQNLQYWLTTVKKYGSWASFIRTKLRGRP